jgi:uncharacterized protein RhaS with RHS repeats
MYDPSVGRWLEQDPIGFDAGDADLYRYVGNEPLKKTDPSGLDPEKKAPEWVPYMKGIEIQSKFKDEGDFRDALRNTIMIYRYRGDLYGKIEPGSKNPEGKNLVSVELGKCKYAFGTNVWVFYTNDKGQVTKVVWANLAPTIPGNPRMGVPPGVAAAAKAELQKQLNKIIDDNRNDPDKAVRAIQELAKNTRIVDPRSQDIRIAWEGPFKTFEIKKKR